MADDLALLLEIAIIQFSITLVAVAVDLGLVFRVFWYEFIRQVPKEDRRYLWAGVANFARTERLAREREARMKEAELAKNAERTNRPK